MIPRRLVAIALVCSGLLSAGCSKPQQPAETFDVTPSAPSSTTPTTSSGPGSTRRSSGVTTATSPGKNTTSGTLSEEKKAQWLESRLAGAPFDLACMQKVLDETGFRYPDVGVRNDEDEKLLDAAMAKCPNGGRP